MIYFTVCDSCPTSSNVALFEQGKYARLQRKSTNLTSHNGLPVLTSILDYTQDQKDVFSRCLGRVVLNINDLSPQSSIINLAVSKKQQQNIMENEFRLRDSDVLVTDSVLDFSKYLTSSDLPASPEGFFDDLFEEDKLEKPLPAQVRIKQEPCYSTSSSRCSTPESLLPEHDFENTDFPSPQFYCNDFRQDSLMYQLQSAGQQKKGTSKGELHEELEQALAHRYPDDDDSEDEDSMSSPSTAPSSPSPRRAGLKSSRRKFCSKGTDEYRLKRERNNIAVRKSRNKTKMKQVETEVKVSELHEANEQLKSKVVLLQRELASLRNFVALNAPSLVSKAPGFFNSAVPNNHNSSIYLNCTNKSKVINGHVNRVC